MNLVWLCEKIIRWCFYLLFILVPLIVTPWNYELFEFNKMMVVYGLTVIITGAWFLKSIRQRELIVAKTPLDLPILFFVISQFVSTLFSMDPHVSWFGYYSRFNGGMWSVVSYVLLFYAFVSNFTHGQSDEARNIKSQKLNIKKNIHETHNNYITFLLRIILATGVIVAIYGLLERTGNSVSCLLFTGKFDVSCWVQDVQNRVFATLGQPNWLGAYLVALTPIAMALGLRTMENRTSKIGVEDRVSMIDKLIRSSIFYSLPPSSMLYFLSSILLFLTLLSTRSRSGFFGFAVADLIFWGLLFLKIPDKKVFRLPFVICHLSFVIILFMNGSNISQIDKYFSLSSWMGKITKATNIQPALPNTPTTVQAPLLEVGGTESGKIRKYVWQGAINAWRGSWKNYFIGTGTETFAFAFYQYRPAEHNLTSEWDFLYNKAHNEYLNFLATTGLFGLMSYLALISTFIIWFVKFSIFKFQFSMKISNFKFQIEKKEHGSENIATFQSALFAGWLSILVTNFFGFSVVTTQLIFFLFPAIIIVLSLSNQGDYKFKFAYPKTQKIFSAFIIILAVIILYFLIRTWFADKFFATGYRLSKLGQYPQAQNYLSQAIKLNSKEPLYHDEYGTDLSNLAIQALENQESTIAGQLTKKALNASDQALTISPKNVNYWKSRTKIFYTFASYDPEFAKAASVALVQAQKLSPNDPKIYYNLAVLTGQEGDDDKAIELLLKAKELKPNYRDAYFGLYIFYNEIKQSQKARAVAQEYLIQVDPNDKEFLSKIQ